MLAKFLLGRGIGKAQELVSKAVRHGLTTVGGAHGFQGLVSGDDMQTLQGAAAIAVGVAFSFARTFLASKVG
jgi:hypothetical protein